VDPPGFPARDTSSKLDSLVRFVRQIYPKRSDDARQDNSIQLGTLLVVARGMRAEMAAYGLGESL
jgi:hypothetical protein